MLYDSHDDAPLARNIGDGGSAPHGLPHLVGHLREDLANADIVWWVTAVADGGAFR